MSAWPPKDPDEVLDYTHTWELEEGETIVSSTYSVAEGDVVIDTNDVVGATASGIVTRVWLSGGTVGTRCRVLERVETSEGRVYDKTTTLRIRSK